MERNVSQRHSCFKMDRLDGDTEAVVSIRHQRPDILGTF